jgi:hypothetical protein
MAEMYRLIKTKADRVGVKIRPLKGLGQGAEK